MRQRDGNNSFPLKLTANIFSLFQLESQSFLILEFTDWPTKIMRDLFGSSGKEITKSQPHFHIIFS